MTYYRWRQEFGGLRTEQVKRLKDLALENSRLRKAVSDLTLDKLILQEAAGVVPAGVDDPQFPVLFARNGERNLLGHENRGDRELLSLGGWCQNAFTPRACSLLI